MAEVYGEISEFQVEVEQSAPLSVTAETPSFNVNEDDPNAAYQYELLSCLSRLDNQTYGLQAIKNAFAALQTALQGNDTTATLTALKTVITAIQESALSTTDKEWLTNKFNSITIDTSTLAKEATLGTANDTASSQTIFGKIANLLSTLTTWISGSWTTFVATAATKSDIPTDYAKEANATSNKQAIISAMPSVAGLATEANATANRTALTSAISSLQGSNEQATLTAIYTIVGAITSGLTDADKTWLLQQFAAIDLSAITSRLDNSTYGLNALKTAIESITFDTSTLAQRTDVKDGNDTTIGMLKDSTYGLSAIKTAIPTLPTDYAKAGQVAQTLDDIQIDTSSLAKQGADTTATNTAIKQAVDSKVVPTDYAKQGSNTNATNTAIYSAVQGIVIPTGLATEANATANKNAILAAMPSEATLKPLYAARAEANNDGTDTYTIVFPYTAQVETIGSETIITV